MAKNLSSSELDGEQVELLPARTLVSTLLIPVRTSDAGTVVVDALNSGATDAPSPPCEDIPWWAPKPPEC